jgi:hypothetical protein
MTIEIGVKDIKELTAENLRQIAMIEGYVPSLEYWEEPDVIEFNNTMFSDCRYIDITSVRKSDGLVSKLFTFWLTYRDGDLSIHHTVEGNKYSHYSSRRVGFKTLAYLIKEGFHLPLK